MSSRPPASASVASNPNYSSLIPSQLYVGDLATASDVALLDTLGITHVVSCGFARGPLNSDDKYTCLCLDPLQDDPASNLVRYLPRVTAFIENAIDEGGTVLVHCVHGQSRSCAVCVAFLMRRELQRRLVSPQPRQSGTGKKTALHRSGEDSGEGEGEVGGIAVSVADSIKCVCDMDLLRQCYDFVESRNLAMAINPGFVRQLELFRRMGCGLIRTSHRIKEATYDENSNDDIVKLPTMSRPHASFRSFKCRCEYWESGTVAKFFPSPAEYAGAEVSKREETVWKKTVTEKFYRCFQCKTHLFHYDNVLDDWTIKDETSIPQSEYWSNSAGGREFIARRQHRSNSRSESRDKGYDTALGNYGKVIHVEPIKWMKEQMVLPPLPALNGIITEEIALKCDGHLSCPACHRKIGSWDFLQEEAVGSHPYACVSVISGKVELR